MPPLPLPVDPHLPEVLRRLRASRFLVLTAPPGAGKTTRVPPVLAEDGPVIVLQPRRVAARALARRIAEERGLVLGEEVGWQVRFERRFSARTRILVATEGILTARLQDDPLLSGFRTVVVDEFHERSIHADLALALTRQACEARDDLRLVVMSATLDAAPVAAYLGGCPILAIEGRAHPVAIEHAPNVGAAEAVLAALSRPGGHVLAFLPGAPEIERLRRELAPRTGGAPVLPLHGGLDADAQDAAIAPSAARKVILATNLAETSLTVEGVTDVVDTGRHKVLRLDPSIGIDRLETERISRDAAEQRAGRAGRTGPGRAVRLWDERELLREHREPEIARVDLAAPVLDVLAWGGDPRGFPWFEAPAASRLDDALALLERLDATRSGRITDEGRRLRRLPLHPRLAKVLLEAGGSREAAEACARLSEPRSPARAARDLEAAARRLPAREPRSLAEALHAGFPDRVAQRRGPGSRRFVLLSGHGAVLAREAHDPGGPFVLALDVAAGARGAEALLREASHVDPSWLSPERVETEHVWDESAPAVRAFERGTVGALVVTERPAPPDPEIAQGMVAARLLTSPRTDEERRLLLRAAFAGREIDLEAAAAAAARGATRLAEADLAEALRASLPGLDRLAPETLPVPSGRRIRLDYREDGSCVCAVKLQELFGLAETPTVGPDRKPVVFELLAPSGRPVQTTRDLRSFWERTYPEVRKELRGRYPRHPWPEDPWSAPPTHKVKRRG